MAEINICGDIIANEDKWIYNWLEWESTCPNDIKKALSELATGDMLTVCINSGGGSVCAGQEIYSLLKGRKDIEIKIQSLAGSAASVIAMANRCEISPVAMIMIHNVSMHGASGDYHDMEKASEILKSMGTALAEAYVTKTGKPLDEILDLMDRETWLTANQALELGFVDKITNDTPVFTNNVLGLRLTDEIRQKVIAEKLEADQMEARKKELLNDIDLYGI